MPNKLGFETRKWAFCAVVVCLLLAIVSRTAQGQTGGQMTAVEFERSIKQALKSSPNDPSNTCRDVIERLKAERLVTDGTVMACVEASINADDKRALSNRAASAANHYASANQFITAVSALLVDRDLLRARLLARQGSLAVATADFSKASQAFEAAIKTVQPVRLDADFQWMTSLVSLGQSLLSQKRNKEAESYFLEALSYQWYTIVGFPSQMRMLRDQYIQAGRGLIACRRGNLKALQEIVFVPATEQELGPVLEKAIEEAKASK